MKKKVATLVIIAILSEIAALSGVFLILTHLKNKDNRAKAAGSNASSANIMPAYASIYGDKLPYSLTDTESDTKGTFDNIEAEIIIEKDRVLINETLYFVPSNEGKTADENPGAVFLYIPSLNSLATNIKKVTQGEEVLNFQINDLMLKIDLLDKSIESEGPEGEDAKDRNSDLKYNSVSMEYEIFLNKSSGTISRTSSHIYLTNFLATPAILKDGKPIIASKSSFGDPYIYNITNYSINFIVDKDVDIYAPGTKKTEKMDNGKNSINFEASYLRDFPVVILKNDKSSDYASAVQVEKIKDTEIYFINSHKARDFVKEAFLFAYENIGPYPYEKFFVVESVDMPLRGMEFSNMIFLSKSCFNNRELLKRVTYHEVFHQWFYGIIGTDQVTEPFLDEGLVNYLAMYLTGDKLGNTYDNSFLKKDLKDYVSVNEYYDLAYDDAAVYFADVHKQLGNNFYEMLKKIYNDKKYSILYYSDFEEYLTMFSQGGK